MSRKRKHFRNSHWASHRSSPQTLVTLAKLNIPLLGIAYGSEAVADIRDELKNRRLEAQRTLDEVTKAEKEISDAIINSRRERKKAKELADAK